MGAWRHGSAEAGKRGSEEFMFHVAFFMLHIAFNLAFKI